MKPTVITGHEVDLVWKTWHTVKSANSIVRLSIDLVCLSELRYNYMYIRGQNWKKILTLEMEVFYYIIHNLISSTSNNKHEKTGRNEQVL